MKHLNEATIQALLDGELADEATARATQHLALCGRCANALLEAEAEQSEVNSAFAAETSASPCPSQRIWARIENEIDFLGAPNRNPAKSETKSFWQQLSTIYTPAQTAFASGLALVVLAAFFAVQILQQAEVIPIETVAENRNPETSDTNVIEIPVITSSSDNKKAADYAPKRLTITVDYRQKITKPKTTRDKEQRTKDNLFKTLPEEQNYLNSIAQLSKAVQTSDEVVMRPAFRVDYERNLAVMNGAIFTMQKQVRRNPKDENAKRILFASYQNKIELLNTVAEKSQMIASLR